MITGRNQVADLKERGQDPYPPTPENNHSLRLFSVFLTQLLAQNFP